MQTIFRSHPGLGQIIVILAILIVVLLQPGLSQARVGDAASEMALSQSGRAPAIVYSAGDGHVHEIALKGTWQDRDLTVATSAPFITPWARPMAYRRSDGVSTVIYRGNIDNHIHELYLELHRQGNSWYDIWHWADLTAITGSPVAVAQPYGYIHGDGISAVVYVGSDYHVHELRLENGWQWADLTLIAGAPEALISFSASGLAAFVRGDGITTVVFQDTGDHICELRLEDVWKWADLTALAGAPTAKSWHSAYVRSDGISTINYVGYDNHVYELRLENGWQLADLTAIAGAPPNALNLPSGYVRSDGINTVVYAASDDRVYELRLDNGWKYFDMTSIPDAVPGVRPVGYVRADGISAVVYRGVNEDIQEIRLENDGWHRADLTRLAGAPTASEPWPYNKSVVSFIYLPLMLRQ